MNIKLTTQEDLKTAEILLSASETSVLPQIPLSGPVTTSVPKTPLFEPKPCSFRIGHGYDVHALTTSRDLILCGVKVPHTVGLLGHSDADVALHALMDALLGAAALGDIGCHFPDSDPQYKGISSILLLRKVMSLLKTHHFSVVNVDLTIVAQKPKLAPYIPEMVKQVASVLSLPEKNVNIKATTTEHLGFEGRMEGISAQSVCLLRHKSE